MRYFFLQAVEFLLCWMTAAVFATAAQAQTLTLHGSVSLNGSGTLTYTATRSPLTPCNPNAHTITPSYTEWVFSQFVFTDASGVAHPLTGSTDFIQVNGSGPGCPGPGGSAIVLNGSGFFINVQPESGSVIAALNVSLFPQYYVLSVLYAPPGNQSSNGFTDASSDAATTSISSTFASATMTSVGISAPGGSGVGAMFGESKSTQNSSAYTFSTSLGSGTQVSSNRNPIDHTQDQIYLWLNPAVTVSPTSSSTANYSLGTQTGTNGQPEPMDIVNVPVADLQNPSLIPLTLLQPQSRPNSFGVTINGLPGLASVCANPVPQCTAAPCGCVASDFANILAADPLIGSAPGTPPAQVDPNRYVFINAQSLEGPECPGCDVVKNSFTETDATTTAETETQTNSSTSGYSITNGLTILGAGLKITDTHTFTWTNAMSVGTSNGKSHAASVTLGTTSVDCVEGVNIYEDTVYHTFAFAPTVTPPASCN